jgi:hypothetical protein
MSTTLEPEAPGQDRAPEPEAPAPVERDTCPSCGAPAEAGQLMCLECGSRLALDYQRPPSWRLPAAVAGAVVVLAGAALAFTLAQVTDDAGKTAAQAPAQAGATGAGGAQPAPADAQAPTAPAPSPAPTTSAPAAVPPAESTPAPATPAPAAPAEGWPAGKEAFTVVLASMPTKEAADAKLKAARDAGIAGAAVLHSDDFPSLKPGYWVVFDGQFDDVSQATSQAEQDRGKGFADAYPRFVSKSKSAP